jgi:hypothetical protein
VLHRVVPLSAAGGCLGAPGQSVNPYLGTLLSQLLCSLRFETLMDFARRTATRPIRARLPQHVTCASPSCSWTKTKYQFDEAREPSGRAATVQMMTSRRFGLPFRDRDALSWTSRRFSAATACSSSAGVTSNARYVATEQAGLGERAGKSQRRYLWEWQQYREDRRHDEQRDDGLSGGIGR